MDLDGELFLHRLLSFGSIGAHQAAVEELREALTTQQARIARKLTITIDDAVYRGLYRTVGKRRISRFLEDLARPHVTDRGLEAAYREMAADERREAEASEWTENLVNDVADATR